MATRPRWPHTTSPASICWAMSRPHEHLGRPIGETNRQMCAMRAPQGQPQECGMPPAPSWHRRVAVLGRHSGSSMPGAISTEGIDPEFHDRRERQHCRRFDQARWRTDGPCLVSADGCRAARRGRRGKLTNHWDQAKRTRLIVRHACPVIVDQEGVSVGNEVDGNLPDDLVAFQSQPKLGPTT